MTYSIALTIIWLATFMAVGYFPGVRLTLNGKAEEKISGFKGMLLAPLVAILIGFVFFLGTLILTVPFWAWMVAR